LLVWRTGDLVSENYWSSYGPEDTHILNSVTKTVGATLTGVAVRDGLVDLDDFVADRLSQSLGPHDDLRRAIRVRHLLTMTSGISWPQYGPNNVSDSMGQSPDWVEFILQRPMAAEPGSVTNYSNGDAHLLGVLLQLATGQSLLDYGRRVLFDPLGIKSATWDLDPQGFSIGSATLSLRPRDLVTLGQLYLNQGRWHGTQVVPADWIGLCLTPHVEMATAGGAAGYGYSWWIYPDRGLVEAWGGAGQRIGVLPDLDTVVVMTGDIPDDRPRSPLACSVYDQLV
jgi:CubicO group peptidase (beta-lactamase class C family)